MHRALEISELVELICFQFSTNDHGVLDKESSKALAALGRTSKTFCNPALNRLWRRQDTITNLLECMPVGLWDIQEAVDETLETASVDPEKESPLIITLLRPIISSDWNRPQFYTPRVKDFSLETEFVTVDFFDALGASRMGDCIFPNLGTLHWMQQAPNMFHYVRLFLAPRVTELSICSIQTFSHLSTISTLPGRCPAVKKLQIELQSSDLLAAAISVVSRAVCGLVHLEALNVPALNAKALAHISQLSNLRYLSLESAEGMTAFLETRAAVCFPATFHVDPMSPGGIPHSSFQLLRILMAHQKYLGFDLDDATILLMARTWPQIATLSLTANPCRHIPSRVTLEGLVSLSKYCPDLGTLDTSFDATTVPPIRDQGKTRVGQQTLVGIGVGCSPVGDAGLVAEFLAVIFPRLKYFVTLRSELLEQTPPWTTESLEALDAEVMESGEGWRDVEDQLMG
ncbi:hypothetical protein C8R46DRAFT_1262711 [Mycena filopes]|nr:hypothetical protein C8R46DRAFT_1262711 [Mycena filopes]